MAEVRLLDQLFGDVAADFGFGWLSAVRADHGFVQVLLFGSLLWLYGG